VPDDNGKPTFDELRDAMMPPGTDKEALWKALKGAHRTGGYVPGRAAPDVSFGGTPGWMPFPPAVGSAPPDPFTKGSEAAGALAEMYEDLLGAGIPLSSVENILGVMLATYGAMTKDEP